MLDQIEEILSTHHNNQPEFHQAVIEFFTDIQEIYQDHSKYSEYSIAKRLLEPDRTIKFRVCWSDNSNKIHVNRGFRVQFNNALGAYKGGLRFHPTVNESILKFLGFEQTFKNALTGLPMGGAKGGSDFNPRNFSDAEILRFCQSFMQELYQHIGDNLDVPAGDINVGPKEIGYLFGHYLKITNRWEGVLTGKNPEFGGSYGRLEATGFGCVYFLEEMLHSRDDHIKGKKVLISGAGNVALHAAQKCLEKEAIVLTLSDSHGTLYFKNGLTNEQLQCIKESKLGRKGRLKELDIKADYQDSKKPWSIGADIAMPCATQNELNLQDAVNLVNNGIQYVIEGANMPLTQEAQELIIDKNIPYAPGKAANAGGVAISGLERTQNMMLESWSQERVDKDLKRIMKDIYQRCIQYVDKIDGVYPYRKGANIAGFKKVADVLIAYGIK